MSQATSQPTAPADFAGTQRGLLLEERDRLLSEIDTVDASIGQLRDNAGPSDVDFSEEGGEGATTAVERDRLVALRAQLLVQLEAVDAAVARLDDGSYGTCRSCGGPIGEARLEALPAATECVSCKSASPLRRR